MADKTADWKPQKVGGQAVMEGVMMKAPNAYAVAVRQPDDNIVVKRQILKVNKKRWRQWPFIRGVMTLGETLKLGISALYYSASQSSGEEEQLSEREMLLALVLGIGGAVLLFMVLPTVLTGILRRNIVRPILLNLAEGGVRVGVFVAYIALISRMSDIQRVFAYHGAEHKTIACYEQGLALTPENARAFGTAYPRCGTAFLLLVMLVSIVFFSFFGWMSVPVRIITRIVFLPVIAGISYEIMMQASRNANNPFWRIIIAPGLWLQRLTTREPDDAQLEVAITALVSALGDEPNSSAPHA